MNYKGFYLTVLLTIIGIGAIACSAEKNESKGIKSEKTPETVVYQKSSVPIDSLSIVNFFITYPDLKKYESEVMKLYQKHNFTQVWHDSEGTIEFAHSLYTKSRNLDTEGVKYDFSYDTQITAIFDDQLENTLSQADTDLMITNLYMYCADKVVTGIGSETTKSLEWLLPHKEVSYATLLDSTLLHPEAIQNVPKVMIDQYYKLRDVLQKYRTIEKNGGWNVIDLDPKLKAYKIGDTATAIIQIKERLFITGDLKENNQTNIFDKGLLEAVKRFQKRNGNNLSDTITPQLINEMNVPVSERIKTIVVNMERCRWISPKLRDSREYVMVNIPSYRLTFIRDQKVALVSPVVVGKIMTKTVIFSGDMTNIVFSPYWNVPRSIINKEIKPGMAKNSNYLAQHNMEWNGGNVRQKPGPRNSLGLVKFIFPNSNNIYLHDTPSKSLFEKEDRAFSHGCVRVGKPRDLAIELLKEDPNWTPQKIDAAMNRGVEYSYRLKNTIPVYIGYFTAWVSDEGDLQFFKDIYKRDDRLAELIYSK
jgi:murein L,D-transpeptidase YcbB/YkuD